VRLGGENKESTSMISRPTQTMWLVVAAGLLGASLAAKSVEAEQGGPTPQERVAALKQSMQESQTKLRQYEWIETTIISVKGEERAERRSAATTARTAHFRKCRLAVRRQRNSRRPAADDVDG